MPRDVSKTKLNELEITKIVSQLEFHGTYKLMQTAYSKQGVGLVEVKHSRKRYEEETQVVGIFKLKLYVC